MKLLDGKDLLQLVIGFIGTLISIDPFGAEINIYVFVALLCPLFASASYLIVRKYGYQESLFSFLYSERFL